MIPKIIHYCWFGGSPKPKLAVKCLKSWQKYCSDFEIKEWNERNFDIASCPLYVRQAYEAQKWAFVTDYARLWIIYNYGGIYFDTDVEVIKDITPLLKEKAFMGFEFGCNNVNTGLGVGAQQGNPIIKANMDVYNTINFLNSDGTYNTLPCPKYTTDVLEKYGLNKELDNEIQYLNGITIYPWCYFCPKDFLSGKIRKNRDTYTIHHYGASWYSKGEKKILIKVKIDYWIHLPNRLLVFLLGKNMYQKIKKLSTRNMD